MNKYEYILQSLNFKKIENSFILDNPTNNILTTQILIASQPGIKDKIIERLKKHLDDEKSYKSIKSITIKEFEQNRIQNKLNINIIYDNGNSEYTMLFENNFHTIFLETMQEERNNKLNNLLK